jgi:hypothetical protein
MSFLRNKLEEAARAKKVVLDHFSYTLSWVPLAANATVAQTIPISADSDFLWMETCFTAFTAAGVLNPAPDELISFQDVGAGRLLQDNPLHVTLVSGNGQWPYVLPEPKLLIGNGGLQVTLQNLEAVQQATVRLVLIGVKVFYVTGFNRSQLLIGY